MMAPKGTAAKKQDAQGDFYVGLLESESMQRELLEAKKNSLVLLKRIEKAFLLREQRLYLEGELRSAISSLSDEIHRVMENLPELPKEASPKKPSPKQPAKPAAKTTKPDTKQMSEIDRKLAEIDKRLAGLE